MALVMSLALWGCGPGVAEPTRSPSTAVTETTSTSTGPTTTPPSEVVCEAPLTLLWIAEPGGPPLTDGDAVLLEHGPQGGWHIALQAGIDGAETRTVIAHAEVSVAATGERLAGDDNRFGLGVFGWTPATCAGTMRGMLAYLDDPVGVNQDYVCGLVGQELTVSLSVEDQAGTVSDTVELWVVGVADPDDDC